MPFGEGFRTPLVQGTTQINQHCTFSWRENDAAWDYRGRTFAITRRHCPHCIAELKRSFDGASFTFAKGTMPPPKPR